MRSRDHIHLQGLELACIVGLRPHERKRPQPIRVDVTLGLDLSRAGRSSRILHTIDYCSVVTEIETLLKFREYRLIEMATEEVCAMLFASHKLLETVALRIDKPEALRGRALASVTVERSRESFPVETLATEGAERERFLETHEATLDLVRLSAHQVLPSSGLQRICWVTEGSAGGVPREPFDPLPIDWEITGGSDGAAFFVCELKSGSSRSD